MHYYQHNSSQGLLIYRTHGYYTNMLNYEPLILNDKTVFIQSHSIRFLCHVSQVWPNIAVTGVGKSVESGPGLCNSRGDLSPGFPIVKHISMKEMTSYLVRAEKHKRQSRRHCLAGSVHCHFQKWSPGVRILDPT